MRGSEGVCESLRWGSEGQHEIASRAAPPPALLMLWGRWGWATCFTLHVAGSTEPNLQIKYNQPILLLFNPHTVLDLTPQHAPWLDIDWTDQALSQYLIPKTLRKRMRMILATANSLLFTSQTQPKTPMVSYRLTSPFRIFNPIPIQFPIQFPIPLPNQIPSSKPITSPTTHLCTAALPLTSLPIKTSYLQFRLQSLL